jgi:diguanylate cyclase (GGDEF)-like protein
MQDHSRLSRFSKLSLVLFGAAVLLSGLAYLLIHESGSFSTAAVFPIIPIAILSLLFGFWGGFVTGLATFLINVLQITLRPQLYTTQALWDEAFSAVLLILCGYVIGKLGDLRLRSLHELTVQKRMEQELRGSEERNQDLLFRAQRQARELALLGQVRTAIADKVDTSVLLHTIVEAVAQTFHYKLVSIYMVQGDLLVLHHQVGYEQVFPEIPLGQGIVSRVVLSGQPVLIKDVSTASDFMEAIAGILSEVAVPLYLKDKVIGVLNIESTREMPLDEADLELMLALGKDIQVAFERAQLYADIRNSEERFRTSIESLLDGFAIFSSVRDPAGRIVDFRYEYINDVGCKLNQRPPGEQIGRTILDLLPGQKEAGLIDEYARVVETGEPLIKEDNFYEDINGEGKKLARVIDFRAVKLGDGIALVWRDVTERRKMEAAEREQRILAEALVDTAVALAGTQQLDEVLERILMNASRVVPHENANIMLVEEGVARVVKCINYRDPAAEEFARSIRMVVSSNPNLSRMSATRKPVVIPDTRLEKEWVHFPETKWILSYAGAPIQVKGKVVGFINLNAPSPGFFNEQLVERLQAFSNQAALAIENAQMFEEMGQFARRMAILNEMNRMANKASNLQYLNQMLADRLGELFEADGAYITLWDEEKKRVIPAAAFGNLREIYPSIKPDPGEQTMTASVLETERVLAVEDVFLSPYISPRIAAIFPAKSLLGMPLIVDGRKMGAALIGYNLPHRFSPAEIALGEQIAGQVALAIAKVIAFEAEKQRTQELARTNSLITALSQVASHIVTASDPEEVMSVLGQELLKLELHCSISMFEPASDHLALHYITFEKEFIGLADSLAGISLKGQHISPEQFSFFDQVLKGKQAQFSTSSLSLILTALPELPPEQMQEFQKAAGITENSRWIFLPLTVRDQAVGLLTIWGDKLERDDLPAASVFASQVATALEKAGMYRQTQVLAITDELTGLYNRRGLVELGQREVERSRRFHHPLSAIMLDIDHFKLINDTYGHPAGDEVLVELANRCKRGVREIDIVSRYGGEEFLILLSEAELHHARETAERLRKLVERDPFPTKSGEMRITISLGVTEAGRQHKGLPEVIELADQALYLAKNSGRNCVAVLEAPTIPAGQPART